MELNKKRFVFLKAVLALGILISLFLLYEHFSPSASSFCSFGNTLDCGIVNKSPYASLDGISYLFTIEFGWNLPLIDISSRNLFFKFITANAFLGFLTLIFLFFLLKARYNEEKFLFVSKKDNKSWIRGITLFSLVYSAYLLYIEHSILKTYCIFCLALDLVLIVIFYSVWKLD